MIGGTPGPPCYSNTQALVSGQSFGPMHLPLLQYRVDLLAEVELAVDVAHSMRQLQRTQQDPLSQGEGEPQHVVGV